MHRTDTGGLLLHISHIAWYVCVRLSVCLLGINTLVNPGENG